MTPFDKFPPVKLNARTDDSGVIYMSNDLSISPVTDIVPDWLTNHAKTQPETIFLTEAIQSNSDDRRSISYADAEAKVNQFAACLLKLPVSKSQPLMIVAANSINHAMFSLAAMRIGVPVAVISPSYCSGEAAPWRKFRSILAQIAPGLIVADDRTLVNAALAKSEHSCAVQSLHNHSWLENDAKADIATVSTARALVTADSIAKLLCTSGSTGMPKAVVNTHRMMVSNMLGIELVWPFLRSKPPIMVDWLPWNHTFGGNCCFDIALFFGGTMHIDDGKPIPTLIGQTARLIQSEQPTIYFNVPAGYEALLTLLERDPELSKRFFAKLVFLFNAGAALPRSIRNRLEAVSRITLGHIIPILGGWGSTETAPFSTVIYFDNEAAANLGVPLPGLEIKLMAKADHNELRVRGPNVTPGYWNRARINNDKLDPEGFFKMGDAGRLLDRERPELGILFDGRIAENFKLNSGTWVNVGGLRTELIAASDKLISDAVIVGEGQSEIGTLIFMNEPACRELGGSPETDTSSYEELSKHPLISEAVEKAIAKHNARQTGTSMRIARFVIMDAPPSLNDGEITDKGYLNQREVIRCRKSEVDALYN